MVYLSHGDIAFMVIVFYRLIDFYSVQVRILHHLVYYLVIYSAVRRVWLNVDKLINLLFLHLPGLHCAMNF